MMRASALSRALLSSSEQPHQYTRLFNAAAYYGGSSRRFFSTSMRSNSSGSYTASTKLFMSFGGISAAVGGSLLLTEGVYAKEMIKPELVPKEVVLYQYEACPFCNKVKGIVSLP